jgi:hypothetical protein
MHIIKNCTASVVLRPLTNANITHVCLPAFLPACCLLYIPYTDTISTIENYADCIVLRLTKSATNITPACLPACLAACLLFYFLHRHHPHH